MPKHARKRSATRPPRSGDRAYPRSHNRAHSGPLAARLNPRWSAPRADRRTGSRRSTYHRMGASPAPIPLPFRQFQALFDSLFKVLLSFPNLFAIGLAPYLAWTQFTRPNYGLGLAIPKQPDLADAPREMQCQWRSSRGTDWAIKENSFIVPNF
ncbi:UNVERIFIED_CONTAM: hypothetical protein Sangu_1143400 [Sesamum angustifolium]|uniref:Uncharacterized protein n=1 Tax=Sesamum angustifolium TaxID=2727405 RepID=A0AAW2P0Z5_9LAMI